MRISFINPDGSKRGGFAAEAYHVLGYYYLNEDRNYIFINDDMHVVSVTDEIGVTITDPDTSYYIQRDDLNFNRAFFIDKLILEVLDIKNRSELGADTIWHQSKMYRYYKLRNIPISTKYVATVLNEQYKINFIEGFLEFGNTYMNFKSDTDYYELFSFFKQNDFKEQEDLNNVTAYTDIRIEEIDIADYKKRFIMFVSERLYDETPGDERSVEIAETLFTLTDSIYMEGIQQIFICDTYHEHSFVMKYADSYYYLTNTWYS